MLFTFPSRYWFTIGRWRVFSLTRWSSQIHTRYHVSRVTWEPIIRDFGLFAYRTVTVYGRSFQIVQLRRSFVTLTPDGTRTKLVPRHPAYNARRLSHTQGLGCCCFARRYYSNRYYFLFLGVLRCFNSPRWLYPDYEFIRKSQDT